MLEKKFTTHYKDKMNRYNYYNTDIKYFIKEYFNSKNVIELTKFYNKNGVISSIYQYKKLNRNGLFIFYCNNHSNLDEKHRWQSKKHLLSQI